MTKPCTSETQAVPRPCSIPGHQPCLTAPKVPATPSFEGGYLERLSKKHLVFLQGKSWAKRFCKALESSEKVLKHFDLLSLIFFNDQQLFNAATSVRTLSPHGRLSEYRPNCTSDLFQLASWHAEERPKFGFVKCRWATDPRPRNDIFDDSTMTFQGPRKVTQTCLQQ